MTKMDQSTLPADSRHINHKTVSADWFQEYPVAKVQEEAKPTGEKSAALDVRAVATTTAVASFTIGLLLFELPWQQQQQR
eukprot:CAMPEP_0172836016 /NCGR_PEP_ID=MMETSP1075-20121228/26198_1 /TAXON_ID=2916 /ORGANISM="Ceratium fusus, Strain PA161109" /LENGTH=79 /DNA_ID=CAMNT_0013679173 /DNA_START=19 /DNA_END=255 /DNA_ORIENTATION=-